jgi:DNA-binding CsgD family transcriptional regulator
MPSTPGTLLLDTASSGDPTAVVRSVSDTLRARLVAGPVFVATADPVTAAFATATTFDIPGEAASAFYAIEASRTDVLSFRALAGSDHAVGSLYSVTEGHPETSKRWREVIDPLRWGDELRAVVRADGIIWGYLCLHREASERAFTPRDEQRLADLLPAVANALRRVALPATATATATASRSERPGTGVLLLDRTGHVVGTSGNAAEWLDELGATEAGRLPLLVAGLVQHVIDSGQRVASLVTTRAGHVAAVEAAPLDGSSEERVVVVLSAAPADHRFDRFALAARLTPREVDVVRCVLHGLATRAIATELDISPATVQAHLTSVFAKTGLRSRGELSSHLLA